MNAAQEITTIDQTGTSVPATQSETSAIVSMIERAAMNPAVDIDKMERLLQMQERILDRESKSAYTADFAAMQPELPSIAERGKGHGTITYALWEHINDAIKPVLAKHGFALSFKVDDHEKGIEVTANLSHRGGHSESTHKVFPADTSGSKNAIQSHGSSISYGKRYLASALLNLTSHAEDDDGMSANRGETITDDQVLQIRDLLLANGLDEKKFLAYIKLASLADITAEKFKAACDLIKGASK